MISTGAFEGLVSLCCFLMVLFPLLTLEFEIQCNAVGVQFPDIAIDRARYRTFTDICGRGAGFECSMVGDIIFLTTANPPNRLLFTHFQHLCRNRCSCFPTSEDYLTDSDNETESDSERESDHPLENGAATDEDLGHGFVMHDENLRLDSQTDSRNHHASGSMRTVAHTCSGSCTQVARSCSWAYTGECMCTAASIPDMWGLFASHGCAAVVASSKLGGRSIAGSNNSSDSSLGGEKVNSSAIQQHVNSITMGSNGYYNVSTGLQVACPCNSTCVSYGCCGSNGTTYAPQDKCLGKLDVANV